MKNRIMWIIAVIVMIGIIIGCVCWYRVATKSIETPNIPENIISGEKENSTRSSCCGSVG